MHGHCQEFLLYKSRFWPSWSILLLCSSSVGWCTDRHCTLHDNCVHCLFSHGIALFWVWERQTSSMDPTAGQLCLFFSLAFFSFLETVHEQPTWSTLQNDWGMYAGQSLLTIGAFLLLICLARFGAWDTFVRIGTVCFGSLLSPCWIDTHCWVKRECNVSGWLWSGLSQLGECLHYHGCGINVKVCMMDLVSSTYWTLSIPNMYSYSDFDCTLKEQCN